MLASPHYSFESWVIKGAPDDSGLFALFRRGELLCIGVASGSSLEDTIRARLTAAFDAAAGGESETITHYQWEITSRPHVKRELYLKQLGRALADCDPLPPRAPAV